MSLRLDKPAPSPCRECPFRRTATPGWLGGGDIGSAAAYLAEAQSDRDINCHMVTTRSCTGLAVFRRNICKLPRGGTALAAVEALKADRQTVFALPQEFLGRHNTPTNRRLYGCPDDQEAAE